MTHLISQVMYVKTLCYLRTAAYRFFQEAFSVHCLLPSLRLLVTIENSPTLNRKPQETSKTLKELIIQKAIIPSRASFLHSRSFSNFDRSDDPEPAVVDLLKPLAIVSNAKDGGEGVGGAETLEQLLSTSLFFHIAVHSLPRLTPKQRSIEDSWLQELFHRLVQHHFHIGDPEARLISSTQHVSIWNLMLHQIANHNIRISTSKLESLLGHIMTYPKNILDAPAMCELIRLCIVIDPNIFIASAPTATDGQRKHQPVPNRRLAALLSWITESAWKKSLETDLVYEAKLSQVVLPLVEAFAKARNLLGFISIWQEQLAVCQERYLDQFELVSRSYWSRTLWEDERLLQQIARLAEFTLTAGQIKNMLAEIHASITSHENSGSEGYPNLVALLVVLDCASGIILDDVRSDQMKDTVRNIYRSTLDWTVNNKDWPVEHKWRLWRILIAFNKRWYMTENDADIPNLEQQAIGKAMELTLGAQLQTSKTKKIQRGYAEELYAFGFVLSLTPELKKLGQDNKHSCHDLIAGVIEWISNHGAGEGKDEKQDKMDSSLNFEQVVQWNGQSDGVTTLDVLRLGYLSQFLAFPGSLR